LHLMQCGIMVIFAFMDVGCNTGNAEGF